MINVKNIVEDNGKPIWYNNAQKIHKVPLCTKVTYEGRICYVVKHTRDCDMEPLYSLSSELKLVLQSDISLLDMQRSYFFLNLNRHPKTVEDYELAADMFYKNNFYDSGISEEMLLNLIGNGETK